MYQDPTKRPLGYLPSNEQYDSLTKNQKIELLEKGIQYVFWTLAKKTREWESEAGHTTLSTTHSHTLSKPTMMTNTPTNPSAPHAAHPNKTPLN